ncbi:beta-ketoacyl-ACP synthase III [Limnobacter parvus]|uniref:Beta-ketoacyl-[acyl-carrier-protein] synthase III n=1 Tax=Limnobacter parvus TaxID=2939690 RepID=A0ABT1XHY2_9BURK|nr:beta-ketoacyl-ACP synthase III [Limnobacter parvus]MCR2746906.1 ketoacyl-ACP synthase III [Limnobacter parvus]
MSPYSAILGTGASLPRRAVSNQELTEFLAAKGVETSAEWIETRTGIQQRYLCEPDETNSQMATKAALRALTAASLLPDQIDLIILATSTPDQVFPSTACAVQAEIGAKNAMAFDIQAVCSGFVYALTVADSMIRAGQARNALVIGSEVFSRLMDWHDRTTCVLFGDGAGAVVLQASEAPGVMGCKLHSDGTLSGILNANGRIDGGKIVGDPFLRMDGQAVFRQAVSVLGNSALELFESLSFKLEDLDFLVPHQANVRILHSVAKKLKLPEERVVITVGMHGNTSAASVPLALNHAVEQKQIKKGHNVLLQGVGGGFTWGSVLVRM